MDYQIRIILYILGIVAAFVIYAAYKMSRIETFSNGFPQIFYNMRMWMPVYGQGPPDTSAPTSAPATTSAPAPTTTSAPAPAPTTTSAPAPTPTIVKTPNSTATSTPTSTPTSVKTPLSAKSPASWPVLQCTDSKTCTEKSPPKRNTQPNTRLADSETNDTFHVKQEKDGKYKLYKGRIRKHIHGINVMGFQAGYKIKDTENWKVEDKPYYYENGTKPANINSAVVAKVKALGFNAVRVPITFDLLNASMGGMSGLKQFISECKGLPPQEPLYILLDCHNVTVKELQPPYFRTKTNGINLEAIYNINSAETFGKQWVTFLQNLDLKNNMHVYGIDIFNEPHNNDHNPGKMTNGQADRQQGVVVKWDDKCDTQDTPSTHTVFNWKLDVETIGEIILTTFPHLIIYVEGNSKFGEESCNWGGNLIGARDQWINPDKIPTDRLVYAATCYGPDLYSHKFPKNPGENHEGGDDYSYFQHEAFPKNLVPTWDRRFGFLQKCGIGPINIKEWGGQMGFRIQNQKAYRTTKKLQEYTVTPDLQKEEEKDALWTEEFVRYMKANDMDYFYWVLCNSLTDDVGALIGENGEVTKALTYPNYDKDPFDKTTKEIPKIEMIKKANYVKP